MVNPLTSALLPPSFSATVPKYYVLKKKDNNWSQYFFENFDQRVEPEITIAFDKKVRIDHIVKTYHINDALIEIGKAKQ